jgi:hypothetical protein
MADVEIQQMTSTDMENALITAAFQILSARIEAMSKKNGFWEGDSVNDFRKLCLVHSELSEITEALRDGNPPDKHLPQFKSATVEKADTIIRIIEWAAHNDPELCQAILAKMAFNETREYLHGRKF